jgi:hypothetical protein
VLYIDEGFAIPEMHSLAPIAYKRRNFEFEREFRLAHVLPPEATVYLDQECDFFRLIDSDPFTFVREIRFHPNAAVEFKERVRTQLAGLGFHFLSTILLSPQKQPLNPAYRETPETAVQVAHILFTT